MPIPHEFAVGGIFLPPLLIASLLGVIVTIVMVHFINRYRLSKFFFYPPLVFLALMFINTIVIGTFIIGA